MNFLLSKLSKWTSRQIHVFSFAESGEPVVRRFKILVAKFFREFTGDFLNRHFWNVFWKRLSANPLCAFVVQRVKMSKQIKNRLLNIQIILLSSYFSIRRASSSKIAHYLLFIFDEIKYCWRRNAVFCGELSIRHSFFFMLVLIMMRKIFGLFLAIYGQSKITYWRVKSNPGGTIDQLISNLNLAQNN